MQLIVDSGQLIVIQQPVGCSYSILNTFAGWYIDVHIESKKRYKREN